MHTRSYDITFQDALHNRTVILFKRSPAAAPHGFEIFSEHDGGAAYYAEGMLRIEDDELLDFDGLYSLPRAVARALVTEGYRVERAFYVGPRISPESLVREALSHEAEQTDLRIMTSLQADSFTDYPEQRRDAAAFYGVGVAA